MFSFFRSLPARLATRQGWRALVSAFGLGAISALALPPVHLVPVLLLTVPGLLILLGSAGSWKRAALLGFCWGWGYHVAGLYWITEALFTDIGTWWWLVPIAVPAIGLPLAAFMVPVAVLAWWLQPGWPRWLGLASAWVLSDMARGVLFTGFPWNLPGSVWAFDALPMQGAALVGVHGLSLITLLLVGLPMLGRRAMLGGVAALAALGGYGFFRLSAEEPAPKPVTLVLAQGNIAQEAKWREEARWPIFQSYLDLTRQGIDAALTESPPGNRIVVVWPETASPFLLANDLDARRFVADGLRTGDENRPAILLGGSVRAEWGPEGQLTTAYNSLVAVNDQAEVLGVYDKAHLVPFGEYMPLRGLIPLRLVQGGVDFSSGPGQVVMTLPGLPGFRPLICYEIIFPGEVVGSQRPEWMLNVTNDAWFGTSAGPYQHLAAARMRAVEQGLPVARAAQTGISAIYDGRGRWVAGLGLGVKGLVISSLPSPLPPTVFSKTGSWPVLIFAVISLGALVVLRRTASILRNREMY
ncbi:apolipoprotein N-acyltransferase [Acetobacteraceae bacterium H6797]|nr:apolipoprotein N-acyltransferase [Acetobacteraceae bacterium H6797]